MLDSQMGANGVIFSNGVEHDYVAFNHVAKVTISVTPRKARLIVR